MIIEEISESTKEQLEVYISSRKDSTFVDTWQWRQVFENTNNLRNYWYIARQNGKIKGFLGLILAKHPIFGRYLATAPFASQGGFYFDNELAFEGLVQKASRLQTELRARYVVIRHLGNEFPLPRGWTEDSSYVTFHIPLMQDAETFFKKGLKKRVRQTINKGARNELKVRFGRNELLDDFYHVITECMRQLGSPFHSKRYNATILDYFNDKVNLVVLYTKKQNPVGCSLIIEHGDAVVQLYGNLLREYRHLNAGEFLDWTIIKESFIRGLKYLDMGRSLIASGQERYKIKWQGRRIQLRYWFKLSAGKELPHFNQANRRYQLPIRIWQLMPLCLSRTLGPIMICGIL